MRKLNTILSVLLVVVFLLHGVLGSFLLLGVSQTAGKMLAHIGILLLFLHLCIGVRLTIQTVQTKQGFAYSKQNALFWTRRASGLAILILVFFHMGAFGSVEDGLYILTPFTTVKLLTQLLLIAALFVCASAAGFSGRHRIQGTARRFVFDFIHPAIVYGRFRCDVLY